MDRDNESYMTWCEEQTKRIWAIKDKDVKGKEHLILLTIFHVLYDCTCSLSSSMQERNIFETLAAHCHLSPRTVKKYCLSLVDKGYLKLVDHQGTKRPRLILCLPKGKRSESDTNRRGVETSRNNAD